MLDSWGARLAAQANSLPLLSLVLARKWAPHYGLSFWDRSQVTSQADRGTAGKVFLSCSWHICQDGAKPSLLPGHVGTELTTARSEHELEQVRGEQQGEEIRAWQDWKIWITWATGCKSTCRGWSYSESIVLELFRKGIFWDSWKLTKKCKRHFFFILSYWTLLCLERTILEMRESF